MLWYCISNAAIENGQGRGNPTRSPMRPGGSRPSGVNKLQQVVAHGSSLIELNNQPIIAGDLFGGTGS